MPSFAEVSARRRWQESPVTGKSTKETVKTIVRGRPDCFGEPVVTTLVCFFNSHARLRVHQAPGFPCALYFSGPTMTQNSDASASRECESVSLRYLTIKSEMNDAGDIEMTSSCPRKSAKRVFALDVAGHPRLPFCPPAKAWMAGSSPAMDGVDLSSPAKQSFVASPGHDECGLVGSLFDKSESETGERFVWDTPFPTTSGCSMLPDGD
jgi:hypothetical protein